MTEILVVSKNHRERVKCFEYLYECFRSDHNFRSAVYGCNIWIDEFFIKLCVNDYKYYRGLRPKYHYSNSLEEPEFYLLSTGSKSLPDLASIVELVKKVR